MSGLPPDLQGLLAPRAYPHAVQSVVLIETHISWVLLTGEWAYKIKRPVHYPFVDLRSVQHRNFLCQEELRLNKRFAPDVYVSVCPITQLDGEVRVAGSGRVIEHAVKMRQFPREEMLDRLLDSARVLSEELEEFGHDLARIHAGLPVCAADQDWWRPQTIRGQILENMDQCAAAAVVFNDADAVRALRPALEAALDRAEGVMSERGRTGRIRECHGDLHCANIVRRGSRLLAFDCLEFDPAFRWMDVAQEVATLLADLHARARPALAAAFLGGYLAQAGDYQACRLLNLYQVHRALVRAKVMALNATNVVQDPGEQAALRRQYQHYAQCAKRCLSLGRPSLILMHGLSGSGKSWLAQRLAPSLSAATLCSDLERRRRAGSEDRYSAGARAQVYQHLANCAMDTLAGGFTTIIDATFGSRAQRAQFQALASKLAVPICLVHCQAPTQVLRARIDERIKRHNDCSEADLKVLEWQERQAEPLTPEEGLKSFEVNTAERLSVESLIHSLTPLQVRTLS